MIDLIVETLAKMYDALVRGFCISLTIIIVWCIVVGVMQHAAPALREAGLWSMKHE